jgi:hypothetical protein
VKILFTVWPGAEYQNVELTALGAQHRLISYWFARELPPGHLERYLRDGYLLDDETRELVDFLRPEPD